MDYQHGLLEADDYIAAVPTFMEDLADIRVQSRISSGGFDIARPAIWEQKGMVSDRRPSTRVAL